MIYAISAGGRDLPGTGRMFFLLGMVKDHPGDRILADFAELIR